MSTVVGMVMRLLERWGLGGVLAALTLNLGWAVATVFATPVIMVEGTMPVATVRRSAGLLRQQFAVTLVSSTRLELPWIAGGWLAGGVAVAGGATWAIGSSLATTAVGVMLVAVGAVGLVFVLAVSSALSVYLEAFLYRHAIGLSIPGVDRHWLPPLRPN